MGRYRAYPEYKDSGVEWFDCAPAHWEIKKISYVALLRSGDAITSEEINQHGEYPVYGGNGLRGYTHGYNHDGGYILIGRQGALCGNINFAYGRFWASEHAVVVYPSVPVSFKFLGETLRSMNLNQYNVSAAQPGLAVANIACLKIPYPPIEEQQTIANFLDHETAKIDTLIEKQQQLIKLLKEKRQAVISHAVTKGLNPDAPMRDSGVEWLGEVPEHWVATRLKYLKSNEPYAFVDGPFGSNLKSEHFVDDGDVYVVESNFATTGIIDTAMLKKISRSHFEVIKRSSTKGGDIIIAKIGARYGSSSILPELDRDAVVSGNSLKLTVNKSYVRTEYANELLRVLKANDAMDDGVNVTAQPALSLGGLNNLPFLKVPIEEQAGIIAHIEVTKEKYNRLIKNTDRCIALAKERRTALISAAVTGKIDVRDWTAPAPQTNKEDAA